MFNQLSQKFTQPLRKLTGKHQISRENVQQALKDIRRNLLEADVALSVVDRFIEQALQRAEGSEVQSAVSPGEALIKVVHDELVTVLGGNEGLSELNLRSKAPVVILVAGLQGAGKTTTLAKLGRWLTQEKQKSVAVVSADVYRPAAIEQLATLAEQAGLAYITSSTDQKPTQIVKDAVKSARKAFADVLLVDTAGRMHIDQEMMLEINSLHAACEPTETLLVVDSMTGQDGANIAKAFADVLPLTGVIATKTDSGSPAGVLLSVKMIADAPIKFIGTGEHIEDFDYFDPQRIADQLLDMGDIVALVKQVEKHVDKKKAEKVAKKIRKGTFDLEDFASQLQQMRNMGGMTSMLSKLPGAGSLPQAAMAKLDDKMFIHMEAIITSMTPHERAYPDLIQGSRKRRIADGSGTSIADVNKLLKQFKQMQKMMKQFKGDKLQKMMAKFGNKPPF